MRLQILEGDLLLKFAAILNMDDNPLWIISLGLRVVVWVLWIESGLCLETWISNIISQFSFEQRTISGMLPDNLHHSHNPGDFAV